MNAMRNAAILVLAGVCALIGRTATAQETDVLDLLQRMPGDAEIVIGSPDVPGATDAAWRWVGAALENLPRDERAPIEAMPQMIKSVCGGAAVVGFRTDDDESVVALVVPAQDRAAMMETLLQFGRQVEENLIAFGPEHRDGLFCSVRPDLLVFAMGRGATAAYPADPENGLLAAPGANGILERVDMRNADLLVLKRSGDLAAWRKLAQPPAREVRGRGPGMAAIQRRLMRAFKLDALQSQAQFVTVDFRDDGIVIGGGAADENGAVMAASPAAPRLDKAFAAWPERLLVSGISFADLFDFVEAAETRFDPDVGDEFREEMAELDRDLGLSFRNDFLASLGNDWAVLIREDDAGGRKPAVWCEVGDKSKVLAGARAMAELGEAPWEEAEGEQDETVVKTAAFGRPFTMVIRENGLALAGSAEIARAALAAEMPAVYRRVAGERSIRYAAPLGSLRAPLETMRPAQAAEMLELLRVPVEGVVEFDLRMGPGYGWGFRLAVSDMTPRDFTAALAPLFADMDAARGEARHKACASNLSQILKACITYQANNEAAWPPNLEALFPAYLDNEKVLICPARGERPSYRFLGSFPTLDVGPDFPVIYDIGGNHPGGRNVGFYDGHVEWMAEVEFQAMLERHHAEFVEAVEAAKANGHPGGDADMDVAKAFFTDADLAEAEEE